MRQDTPLHDKVNQQMPRPPEHIVKVIKDTRGNAQVNKSLYFKIIYKYEDKAESKGPWSGVGEGEDRKNYIFSHQYQLVYILPFPFLQ